MSISNLFRYNSLRKFVPSSIRNIVGKHPNAMLLVNIARMLKARNTKHINPLIRPKFTGNPTVLIVLDHGFLHNKTGSRRVFESQINYLKSAGYDVHACFVYPAQMHNRTPGDRLDAINLDLDGAFEIGLSFRGRNLFHFWKCLYPSKFAEFRCPLDIKIAYSNALEEPNELLSYHQEFGYDSVLCNYVWNLPFAQKIANGRCPVYVETHDVQSRQLALSQDRPVTSEEECYEIRILDTADKLIALSRDEYDFFKDRCQNAEVHLIYPTIATPSFSKPLEFKYDIFFAGSRHQPNFKGLLWFLNEVKPRLPDYKMCIAGSVGDSFIENSLGYLFEQPGTEYLGIVDDLPSLYDSSRVAIVPVLSGHGISIKTIEAMAFGKPVVSTHVGVRGFPVDLDLLVSDDPVEFSDFIEKLLKEENIYMANSNVSRLIFDKYFSSGANKSGYQKVFQNVEVC